MNLILSEVCKKYSFIIFLVDETERAAAIAARKEEAKIKRRKKKKTVSSTSLASNTFQVNLVTLP